MNIGFIGLGKLGLECATVFSKTNTVYGYDLHPIYNDSINICSDIAQIAQACNTIFIAVQTPHDKLYGGEQPTSHLPTKNFDYSHLQNVIIELNHCTTPSHTIVVISTVLPGTIRNVIAPKLNSGAILLYNPYLIAMGTVSYDMLHPEMVIIGAAQADAPAILQLKSLYQKLMPPDVRYETGTWEEAESIKIFYNTFISAKIAIVNMIQDVAETTGNMNVDIVTNALANSTKRITSAAYMKAGMGDGGPCHPRDNIALSWLAKELHLGYDLFYGINHSREQQAQNLAKYLYKFDKPIVILGTNYKPNVSLTDGSYALLVAHYLNCIGAKVFLDSHQDTNTSYTYLLAHEDIFNNYPFNSGSIIVDVWRKFCTNRTDLTIYQYGNTRSKIFM